MAAESVVDLKPDDSVDSVVVSWFPQRTVSLTLRHCSCSVGQLIMEILNVVERWQWQWVHRTSSKEFLSPGRAGGGFTAEIVLMNGAQRCEMHNRAVCRWVGWEWSSVQFYCCHFGQEQLCTQL